MRLRVIAMPSIVVSTALDSTAVTDSPPLRYGTPVILLPLRSMNSSPTKMRQAARAGVGVVDLAGIGLASSTNSLSVFHGESAFTTRIWKLSVMRTIGTKFLTGS